MKKIISTLLVISMLALAALAQTPPNPNCAYGHINTTIFVCEPPPQVRAAAGVSYGDEAIKDESVLAMIENFIAALNPFGY